MATMVGPGYRSDTEFHFDEERTDAIVRTASYHRKDYGLSVIWFSPRGHVDIRRSIATPFPRTANVGLGSLDRLPLELLHETLSSLDMHSLFKLRQTNLRSRQIVDSYKPFQLVISHGLNLFCALLRTRLANEISLIDFRNALCTKACSLCGEYGGFMSLPSWTRCCFKCLKEAPETQVQTLASARKQFYLTKADAARLRSFKTLPGVYTMDESEYKSHIAVVSAHQTSLICTQRPQAPSQVQPVSSERNKKFNFMGSCALSYYDKSTGKVEHGMSCAGCQLALEKGIIGARSEDWASEARDKLYARDGFLEHFRWCEQAQLLWISSDEGGKRPPELPEFARRQGYFNNRD